MKLPVSETLLVGIFFLVCSLASAQESVKSGSWSSEPDYVREWLATQTSPTGTSCCGLGDAINVEVLGPGEPGKLLLKVLNPRSRTELSVGQVVIADVDVIVSRNYDPDGLAVAWVSYQAYAVYCLSRPPMF